MDAERWKLLEELFEQASELPVHERPTFIDAKSAGDNWLRTKLEQLLSGQDNASQFFSSFKDDIFLAGFSPNEVPGPEDHPYIGTSIGPYKIVAVLGMGGMGEVFEGVDTRLDRQVALKFLSDHYLRDEIARKRFISEARAASRLDHPHIATVYDVSQTDAGRPFIAMQCCLGGTLQDLIYRMPLPISDVVQYVLQIANGLSAAHEAGIIHRDIKPGNLLFTSSGSIKIVDFGLARVEGQESLTQAGKAMGTAAYMAPEQVRGEELDPRADIWSLGVILYEMLVRQRPFRGDSITAILYSVTEKEPVPISALRPGIPIQLQHIVAKALQKDRELRYPDTQALIKDLEDVRDSRQTVSKPILQYPPERFGSTSQTVEIQAVHSDKAPVSILIVDDEPNLELLLRQFFKRRMPNGPWPLEFAENGEVALKKIEENPDIALVLTDIQMPVMDGLTLLSHLSKLPRIHKSIVISAYGDIKNIREAMNRGAYDFVIKPIDFEDLQQTILKTTREIHRQRSASQTALSLQSLKNEIELAHSIQTTLLPPPLSPSSHIAVHAFLDATPNMQGDFYDYFWLDSQRFGFFVGDVAATGFTSAMYMAMGRTLLKADAQRGLSPEACMKALNTYLSLEYHGDFYITAFYGILDIKTGTLSYCNAGHNPPYLLSANKEVQEITWDGSIAIGVDTAANYTLHTVQLNPGDALMLVTDGIFKVLNPDGKLYTEDNIFKTLRSSSSFEPVRLINTLIRDITHFADENDLPDDVALLALKYLKKS